MIDRILPPTAASAEAFDDGMPVALFPEEERLIANAVEKRRVEFATARGCAHRALASLGLAPGPVPCGQRGEPIWPAGVVGSIAHCRGYRGCAVAQASELTTLGIDAEPHEPLPSGLLGDIADSGEREALRGLAASVPEVHWDRLLFCAKEAVYKAWYPLAERWLGFEDATLEIDPERRAFTARLLVPGPRVDGIELNAFSGRWLVGDGLAIAAIAITRR